MSKKFQYFHHVLELVIVITHVGKYSITIFMCIFGLEKFHTCDQHHKNHVTKISY